MTIPRHTNKRHLKSLVYIYMSSRILAHLVFPPPSSPGTSKLVEKIEILYHIF